MAETTIIDMKQVYEITGGSEELFRQMMELFIEISPGQLSLIKESRESGEYTSLAAAAHDLKSSASSLAALSLYESALNLEQSAKLELELSAYLPMINDVEEKIKTTLDYYLNGNWSFGAGAI